MKNRKTIILITLCLCVALLFGEFIKSASAEYDSETFAVGSYVTFGTYPQTAEGTDETPIEWLVLDCDGNKALLISRYGLDAQPYYTEWPYIT